MFADVAYLGTLPSMPWTYQFTELKAGSLSVIAEPAATFIAPVLSSTGPAKGMSAPEVSAAFFSSKTLTAAGGIAGLSGAITTMPSLRPHRVCRCPVQVPSNTFWVSAM